MGKEDRFVSCQQVTQRNSTYKKVLPGRGGGGFHAIGSDLSSVSLDWCSVIVSMWRIISMSFYTKAEGYEMLFSSELPLIF